MSSGRAVNWWAVIVVALLFGLVGGGGGALVMQQLTPTAVSAEPVVPAPAQKISVLTDQDAIVKAVKKAAPAVVTIVAIARAQPVSPFGVPFGPAQERQQGLGSGFLFDYEGRKLILTNTHVVAEADKLTVRTGDGQEFSARKLGQSSADLAVIEPINPPADLTVLPLGDDSKTPVGSWVIAVGSPFGIDNTVTVGVVSRKGYVPISQGETRYLLQTDAAINSGNSGGPLLDLGGNVIGVNEMILSPTQTNLGIGWAIPVNEAKELLYFLVHRGPWVGVSTAPNSAGMARYFGLPTKEGVIVASVMRGSPAEKAGLRAMDVITQIDGKPVKTPEEVRDAILAHRIGDRIPMVVQRSGQTQNVEVEAGTVPESLN